MGTNHHIVTFTERNGEQQYDHLELMVTSSSADPITAANEYLSLNGPMEDEGVWIDDCRCMSVQKVRAISPEEFKVMSPYLAVINLAAAETTPPDC